MNATRSITYLAAVQDGPLIRILKVTRSGEPGAMRQTGSEPTGLTFTATRAGQRRAEDHLSRENARLAEASR